MRYPQNAMTICLGLCAAMLMATACGEDSDPGAKPQPKPAPSTPTASTPKPPEKPVGPTLPTDPIELAELGRTIFLSNCIACHNPDPTKDGALGPAVIGSSQALLEARVIHGTYPEGHTPKRDTKVMIPLPFLEPQIPALAAYLSAGS